MTTLHVSSLSRSYYDGDRSRLFREARIVDPSARLPATSASVRVSKVRYFVCPDLTLRSLQTSHPGIESCIICCRDLPTSLMSGLDCGHRFCKECWSSYLTTKIMGTWP